MQSPSVSVSWVTQSASWELSTCWSHFSRAESWGWPVTKGNNMRWWYQHQDIKMRHQHHNARVKRVALNFYSILDSIRLECMDRKVQWNKRTVECMISAKGRYIKWDKRTFDFGFPGDRLLKSWKWVGGVGSVSIYILAKLIQNLRSALSILNLLKSFQRSKNRLWTNTLSFFPFRDSGVIMTPWERKQSQFQ